MQRRRLVPLQSHKARRNAAPSATSANTAPEKRPFASRCAGIDGGAHGTADHQRPAHARDELCAISQAACRGALDTRHGQGAQHRADGKARGGATGATINQEDGSIARLKPTQ